MRRILLLSLALAGLFPVSILHGSPYAASVVSYSPGTGYAAGYTNASAALGRPSTADSYGDAVDPFDPAWETDQMVSIGAGGWVTFGFDQPIVHYPNGNRDFIIFGNSFFDVTNFGASPDRWATQGRVVNDAGQSRVSVSSDGVTFYALHSALAPAANYLYPTDGSGNFQAPVNPALTAGDFAGLTLAEISLLYNGSAGGASYNIAWAQDTHGNPVCLPEISYVRVDVLANRLQIAGVAALAGTALAENFSNNPAGNGWETFGDTNLFAWNAANQDLQVTWDSSQPNSYFYHPLGTVMTMNDDFSVSFDLALNDANTNLDGTNAMQLTVGFLNLAQARNSNFLVGNEDSTNLAEFEFFPGVGGFLPSLDASLQDSNGIYYFAYNDLPWNFGQVYHVAINHAAGTSALTGQILANGQLFTALPGTGLYGGYYDEGAGDFRLDTISVNSFSDVGSAGIGYPSSIIAHGTVKNLLVTAPPPAVAYLSGCVSNQTWQGRFCSRSNWNYTLEKSLDLQEWSPVACATRGNGGPLTLQDSNCVQQAQYYRVCASPQ